MASEVQKKLIRMQPETLEAAYSIVEEEIALEKELSAGREIWKRARSITSDASDLVGDGNSNSKRPYNQPRFNQSPKPPLSSPQTARVFGASGGGESSNSGLKKMHTAKFPNPKPLLKRYVEVYEHIKSKPYFIRPPPGNYQDKEGYPICKYHGVKNHSTESCYQLRNFVQQLISEGKLQEFVDYKKEEENLLKASLQEGQRERSLPPAPAMRTINMILRSKLPESKKIRRMELYQIEKSEEQEQLFVYPQRSLPNPRIKDTSAIWFNDDDLNHVITPHQDALVIMLRIGVFKVKRILVDDGSSTDLMLLNAFLEMGFTMKDLDPPKFQWNRNRGVGRHYPSS